MRISEGWLVLAVAVLMLLAMLYEATLPPLAAAYGF